MPLLLLALCLAAYWPAFDNGFISDDYIFLERVESWSGDFFYLFTLPPENFRLTTYASFLLLKRLFGYHAELFYAFTLCVHFLNCLLFWKIAGKLAPGPATAASAALCFSAVQNPQEAMMWLGGMHEVLLGFFALATLLCWMQGRFLAAALFYTGALFTKESAPVLLLLLPLTDLWRAGRLHLRREYLYLLPSSLLFAALFLYTFPGNSLVQGGFYAFHIQALVVLIKSFHRLMLPWIYLMLILGMARKLDIPLRGLTLPLWWLLFSLLPYIFLTYQDHIPSRQLYLASMGYTLAFAVLLNPFSGSRLRPLMLVCFLAANSGYLWLVKDAQYEERAAPTSALLRALRTRSPQPLVIQDFPQNPWIAKLTTRLVPGWEPEMLLVSEPSPCPGCPVLRWDTRARHYREAAGR